VLVVHGAGELARAQRYPSRAGALLHRWLYAVLLAAVDVRIGGVYVIVTGMPVNVAADGASSTSIRPQALQPGLNCLALPTGDPAGYIDNRETWTGHGQRSQVISKRLTGAPICQLCQMTALRARRRWTTRAHSARGNPSAVVCQAELVLQRPDGRIDRLTQPVREVPRLLVFAGRADQVTAQPGQELLEVILAKPLSATIAGAGCGRLADCAVSNLRGSLTFSISLGLARPNRAPSRRRSRPASAWLPRKRLWEAQ
jgi:hypothetical protein